MRDGVGTDDGWVGMEGSMKVREEVSGRSGWDGGRTEIGMDGG